MGVLKVFTGGTPDNLAAGELTGKIVELVYEYKIPVVSAIGALEMAKLAIWEDQYGQTN